MIMKNERHINEHDELLGLINRYFDGETSVEEERRLRGLLAASHSHDSLVEEARAVMGVFACARSAAPAAVKPTAGKRRRLLRPSQWVAVSAAASVAIIIAAVVSLTHFEKMPSGDILANASRSGVLAGKHDSIAQLMQGEKGAAIAGNRSVAISGGGINRPENPDDVAALISSEMGCMAEAQRTVYESINDDFVSLRDIVK